MLIGEMAANKIKSLLTELTFYWEETTIYNPLGNPVNTRRT